MKSSYDTSDVQFLLCDITDSVKEITVAEKEMRIAKGQSYSEFISKESVPTEIQRTAFKRFMEQYGFVFSEYICILAQKIYAAKSENVVLVSLARAGTPIGILVKRYINHYYHADVPHYSISILRGKGIDEKALAFITEQHDAQRIQFIDGWTGKGSIIDELEQSIERFNLKMNQNICPALAVVADPAKRCELYGTREDIAIPNCFFNATISGLVSRTIHRNGIDDNRYHGACYLAYLEQYDESQDFVEIISAHFKQHTYTNQVEQIQQCERAYARVVTEVIQQKFHVNDRNKVKLSIGEAARVLLRRHAKYILIQDIYDEHVTFLIQLAKQKGIEVVVVSQSILRDYRAAAIIHE